MIFESLSDIQGLAQDFVLRQPGLAVDVEREEAVRLLWPRHRSRVESLGFQIRHCHLAEQVHGAEIAMVGESTHETGGWQEGPVLHQHVDGLICRTKGVMLGIYVADCCAVYLVDEAAGSLGLVHSGKKGSALGIAGKAVRLMCERYGARPDRVRAVLSPCIRPPAYEVDFAGQIQQSLLEVGLKASHIEDTGLCTSKDLDRFYSYRMEKGRTGRMLALLGWKD
jgi:copper oxidase (laccase) domain-containing protein